MVSDDSPPPQSSVRPALVLTAALFLTALTAAVVWLNFRSADDERFENAIRSTHDTIRDRFDVHSALLTTAASSLTTAPELTGPAFQAFAAQLQLSTRYRGLQGIGYSVRVAAGDRDRFIAQMQTRDPAFRLWPPGVRDEYHSVVHLEPGDWRNRAAIGYDMFSEPTRRSAMIRARDTGDAALSGRVALVVEIEQDRQPGFLMYVPVYRSGPVPATAAGRASALVGFVYSPFRADDFLSNIFATETPPVTFQAFDGPAPDASSLLHTTPGFEEMTPPSRLTRDVPITVAGHTWTLRFKPSAAGAFGRGPGRAILAFSLGTLASTGLFVMARGRRRADQARHRNAKYLQLISDAVPALLAYVDETLRYRFVNQTYAEWFSRPLDAIIGRPVRDVLGDGTFEHLRPSIDRVLAGETLSIDSRLDHPQLGARDLHATYAPDVIDGRTIGFVVHATDITDRLRAEQKLRESEQRRQLEERLQASEEKFRTLAETAQEGIITADSTGVMTYANRGAERLFGYAEGELVGRRVTIIIPERAREAHETGLARTVATGERRLIGGTVELSGLRKDGTEVPIELSLSSWTRGTEQSFSAIVRDVTQRRRSEEERAARLTAQAAEHRATFLARASAILGASLDYERSLAELVQLIVPAMGDYTAIDMITDAGELRRLLASHAVPEKVALLDELRFSYPLPADSEVAYPYVIRTGRTELLTDITEEKLRRVAQDDRHLELLQALGLKQRLCVPINARGRTYGAITVALVESGRTFTSADILLFEELGQRTAVAIDNARLYQETQRAYRDAERASRLKDEFLTTLSHELRTPLNAIVGWSHMLKNGLQGPTAAKAIEIISRNAHTQNQLIADILDMQRIAAGKLRLNLRPLVLAPVIEAAVDTVRPAADAKQIRIDLAVDPSTGPVSGDADRMQQILWNLLSNAIKFTPNEGAVRVALAPAGSEVEIVVEDTGPGMDPEFIPYAFDRFRQADSSSTRRHGGLGLGLAIVRNLVELHGGSVAVESGPEGGARLRILLPGLQVRTERRSAIPVDRRTSTGYDGEERRRPAPTLHGVRVLVVDDEPDARELVATVLEGCGAGVTVASSAAEAFAALTRERPDVLLSDLEMPVEDGYAFIERVRALPAEEGGLTPAAALTAYASADARLRALAAGFQIHVPKPVQPDELAAIVARLAGARRDT